MIRQREQAMMTNEFEVVGGHKLILIKKIRSENGGVLKSYNDRLIQKAMDKLGLHDVHFDNDGRMTSEEWFIYSVPGCAFVTQKRIDGLRA